MNLAVYGGSFNPPHLGHVHAARAVLDAQQPDRFLVIPDYQPPHKDLTDGSPPPEARLEMCRLAFRQFPEISVSDLEFHRRGKSYTADTVRLLRTRYPEDAFSLVIGADMLLCFRQWFQYRYLLSECTLLVLSREDGEDRSLQQASALLTEEDNAKISLIPCTPYPASSTSIRSALSRGERPEALDEEVYQYILRHSYYR